METKINSEINYTELIIEDIGAYKEDYQMPMIRENHIIGLLKVSGRGMDDKSQYLYDITGYQSMEKRYEKELVDTRILEEFLAQFLRVVGELKRHMLDVNRLILDPAYIFCKEEMYYFCYYPNSNKNIAQAFHELTEYFVKAIDYTDIESVVMACGLHKETMEAQYNMETILEKHVRETVCWPKESQEMGMEEQEELEIQEVRETPLKRFWLNKKKEKWGTWENLLRQEESSIMKSK